MKIPYNDAIEICEALVHVVNAEGWTYFREEAVLKAEQYIQKENEARISKGIDPIDPSLFDPNL